MDQGVTSTENVCVLVDDFVQAIDLAVWLNFRMRTKGKELFHVIDGPDDNYAVVSVDFLEAHFEGKEGYPLFGDYVDMGRFHSGKVISTDKKLSHWKQVHDAFADMDTEVLIFILDYKVQLDWYIRRELVFRRKNRNNESCSRRRARAIWLKD